MDHKDTNSPDTNDPIVDDNETSSDQVKQDDSEISGEKDDDTEQAVSSTHEGKDNPDANEIAQVIAELEEANLRLRAEFDNYKRRTLRESDNVRKQAAADVITKLLPVIDNFERAIASADDDLSDNPFVQGVRLIFKQFMDVLEDVGLQPIPGVGAPFDPLVHEAVATEVCDETPKGHIIEELSRGYTLNGKVLRVGMVKVAAD